MNISLVFPYVPSRIRVRPFHLVQALEARNHRVTVYTLWSNEKEYEDVQMLRGFCYRVEAVHLPPKRSLLNVAKALLSKQPLQYVYSWSDELAARIRMNLPEMDVLHVEHLRGARYGIAAQANRIPCPPIVWDSVDSISYLFEQALDASRSPFGTVVTRFELPRTKRYEAELVHHFGKVVVTSSLDRKTLIQLGKNAKGEKLGGETGSYSLGQQFKGQQLDDHIRIVPNGVDLNYFHVGGTERDPETIVYSGKMSYHANITAAMFLVEQVMPLVWNERPETKLVIVGKDPPQQIWKLGNREHRILITGEVPDIRPFLQQACVAALPIVYGAGCQNKVLEAMACATPVVTVPQAVSALQVEHGREVLLGKTSRDLCELILDLLDHPHRRKQIGEAGRYYVERFHDWGEVAAQMEDIYSEVTHVKH